MTTTISEIEILNIKPSSLCFHGIWENGEKIIIQRNAEAVETALEWMVFKEFNSQFKINPGMKKDTEKLGLFFTSLLHCCERLQTYQDATEKSNNNVEITRYNSALERFTLIILEFAFLGVAKVFYSPYKEEIHPCLYNLKVGNQAKDRQKNGIKVRVKRQLNTVRNMVKKCTVPDFLDSHFCVFISEIVSLAKEKKSTPFKNNFFIPLLNAWKLSLDEISDRWAIVQPNDSGEKLFAIGKGRTKILLNPDLICAKSE